MIQKSRKLLALLLIALLLASLVGIWRPTEVLADGIFEADEEVQQEESKQPEAEAPTADNNTAGTETPKPEAEAAKPEEGTAATEDEKDSQTAAAGTEDGSYVPSFGFTGGSGRVVISCPELVVKDGKAMATLVFSSSNYTRVTVNGVDYGKDNGDGASTFTIPVELNGITAISAETTAMSQPHEIEYELYIYTDGTDVADVSPEAAANAAKVEADEEASAEVEENENSWGDFDSDQSANTADSEPEGDRTNTSEPAEQVPEAGKGLPAVAVLGILVVVVGGLVTVINAIDKKKKAK